MQAKKNEQIRVFGIIIFFVGSILAIASAAKLPGSGSEFPDTVAIFSVGLIFGIIGNILWHKSERAKVIHELKEQHESGAKNPVDMLTETQDLIEKLLAKIDDYQEMALCEQVDIILDETVHPFTEKSKTFMDLLGKERGAEVLLIVAYGERMLNRVWSAASDHHHPEAKHSLEQSLGSYKMANEKVAKYQ